MVRHKKQEEHKIIFFFITLFVLFYPMLISIYVFLPLCIGVMSYLLIEGLQREKFGYIFLSVLYLINLEVNLSLPLFLTIISALLFYVTLYNSLRYFRRCSFCKALFSVFSLDLFYLFALFSFDFIFQTHSIALDMILLYSLIIDILLVVLL
ncbi:hypothetical protein MNB_SV-3-1299 [hydrothermal vent metagenome]|uniref:Uncharacterized protein n=1 Tax=hydrothermal vent metagenome TaxID=652676 RepID=A0A1W1CRS5_9ZZZZ